MKWYHYLAAFAVGFFFGNAVPHFVAGVMGNAFPSPFATPPGVGLSSPLVNVLWGLTNVFIGYVMLRLSRAQISHTGSMVAIFMGLAVVSIMTSILFWNALGSPSF